MTRERVLLCDDEPEVREVFARALERGGYEVLRAADGEAGAEMAIRERPDVVLMDLQMPVLGGTDATRRIKEQAPEVVVLAFTAHAGAEDIRRSLEAGCDGVILKPDDPMVLAEQIRLCMEEGP